MFAPLIAPGYRHQRFVSRLDSTDRDFNQDQFDRAIAWSEDLPRSRLVLIGGAALALHSLKANLTPPRRVDDLDYVTDDETVDFIHSRGLSLVAARFDPVYRYEPFTDEPVRFSHLKLDSNSWEFDHPLSNQIKPPMSVDIVPYKNFFAQQYSALEEILDDSVKIRGQNVLALGALEKHMRKLSRKLLTGRPRPKTLHDLSYARKLRSLSRR